MDIITHQQLRALLEAGQAPRVTIFMPTHRQGRDVRQDPARLKNLLREAEEKLIAQGMRGTIARDLLEPARVLVEDADFWLRNDAGLAIFLSEGFKRIYRLPVEVDDTVMVNERFDVKPLLPLLQGKLFYVLALAQKGVRLLECTPHGCKQVQLPEDVALSLEEAISGENEHQTTTQRHSVDTSNPFSAGGAFHGQADIQRREHEDRMFFYRQLDEGVRRTVRDQTVPVVLAGADSTVPFYRQATGLKNVVEEYVSGNPEHVPDETLHQKALATLEPLWNKEVDELQEQYGTAYAHKLASDDIYQIVPAAAQGRVGILFVSPEHSVKGSFDEKAMLVDDRADSEDLVDVAAIQTLLTGGQVVVVKGDQVPGNKQIAAIYRYMG